MGWTEIKREDSSTKAERKIQRVLRAIRKAGLEGISLTELTKKTQLISSKERREIIDKLGVENLIEQTIIYPDRGQYRTMYRATTKPKETKQNA